MGLEMSLLATVKPGTVSTNFEQFKEVLQKEMEEKYKSITATDENLQFARDARATLNKAKAQLKSTVTAAKKDNEAPLQTAIAQAKELEAILDDAISTLDVQIKKIEEARRTDRMDKARKILAQKVDKLNPELIKLAAACMSWLENPRWGLAGVTFSELNSEIDEKINRLKQAWKLFQGDFRDRMLDEFCKDGDIGRAQLVGMNLQKEFDEAEKRKAERLAREAEAKAEEKPEDRQIRIVYQDTVPNSVEKPVTAAGEPQITIKAPEAYLKHGDRKGHADFRICCPAYKFRWLLDLCKEQQIEMRRLDK